MISANKYEKKCYIALWIIKKIDHIIKKIS